MRIQTHPKNVRFLVALFLSCSHGYWWKSSIKFSVGLLTGISTSKITCSNFDSVFLEIINDSDESGKKY